MSISRAKFLVVLLSVLLLLAASGSGMAQSGSGAVSFGSVAIRQASSLPVTLNFASAGAPATQLALTAGAQKQDFTVVTGGSCVMGQSYAAGGSCTISVTFAPLYAGLRKGAVVLEDANGAVLASTYIYGAGTGPQAAFQVTTRQLTTFPNLTFAADRGIAVDGGGDLFAASINSGTTGETVVEIPAGCTAQSCVKPLPGTYSSVQGLAVDGAGNLWVGDLGASGRITEILAAGGYSSAKTYEGSFGYQIGVAVDGAGNVYFTGAASASADTVTELTASSGYATARILASGYNTLGGIAVDGSGNVFFADPWDQVVQQIVAVNGSIPSTPTIKSLGSGMKNLSGLTMDGGANLYVLGTDSAANPIIFEMPSADGYTTVTELSNQINAVGLAIDASGNLFGIYYTDQVLGGISANSIFEMPRGAAPSLVYTNPTAPGTTEGPHNVFIENVGNQPLSLTGLKISNGNFSLDADTTTCTASTTLAVGDSCLLAIVFNPLTTGNITGTVSVTDNTLNAAPPATQIITLQGQSQYTPLVSIVLAANVVAVSQALPVTITVNGGSGNPTPTGTIQLSAPGYSPAPVTLSGGSVSATIPAGTLSPGQPVLTATYQPDAASAVGYTAASVNTTFIVTSTILNVPVVTVTPAVESISLGQALTVTVNVSQANGAPMPSGTVTLTGGSYTSPATALSSGSDSVTITIPPNSMGIGTDELVATYTPDAASATIYVSANGAGFVSVSAATTPSGAPPVDFGSLGIGKTSGVTPVTLTFPSNSTPASLIATTHGATGKDFAIVSGGSCGAGINVAAGASCTVKVTFTPGFAGLRSGAVVALDANGETLALTYVHGSGTGAQISIQSDKYFGFEGVYAASYAFSSTTLSDGFSHPSVAVDGAGNVFVADMGSGSVREIPAGCTSSSCTVTVVQAFFAPSALAVDGAGNIFVSEFGSGDVKEIPLGCTSYSCLQTVGTGFNQPVGVAVDASGNLFVADTYNNAVKEVMAAGGYSTIKTLATGLDLPWSVAVNPGGDVFVAEGGDQCQPWIPGSCLTINTSLLEMTAASGYQTINTLAAGVFGKPFGVAVDGSGNLYEADYGDPCATEYTAGSGYAATRRLCSSMYFIYPEGMAVDSADNLYLDDVINDAVYKMDFADVPAMTFRTPTLDGLSDSQDGPQVVSVQNNGTAPLTFSSIAFSDTSFTLDSAITTCSTSIPLAVGSSCYLAVDFAPTTTGPIPGTLTLTNNNLNQSPATQVIQITAVALPPTPVILTNPANPTTTTSATFTFSDTQTPITFVCSIDSLPFAACSSPLDYSALSGGAHAFQVKAVDASGNLSQAAVYNWTVNSVGPPAPVITSAPPAITFDTAAAFSFTDTKAGVTFLCSLDGATFASCTSGVSYTVPALTGYTVFTWHSFAVEAKDNAGNVSAETTLTWMLRSETWLITADPVNFGALPVGQTSSAQAVTFTFTASDTIATIDATTMGIAGLDFTVSDPGTCAVNTAVSKGSTCTLHATFSPKFSGLRKGGVVLLGAAGNGIAAVYLQGVGTAPQLTFTPYSTTFFNVLPPQNNADPGKDLATWVTDAAVDGAGNIYITDGDIGSVDGSVAVSVGSLWEFPVGCTTAACIKLISTEEGASGQQSTSASLLLPNTLVMDGTGMLWGTNWSLAPFVFSTVGNWSLPTGAWYAVDCFLPWVATTIYPNGSAVDGAGISSFVANGMLAVCGSQVGVASTASGQSSSAGGTKDKPQAIGGGGNSLSFDFSASTTGLTVDPEGNIFVADAGNNAIKEVLASSNYTIDRTVGGSVFNNPGGLASDANGNIFVADIGSNTLKEIVAASGYTQVLTIATFDSKAVDFGGFVNGYANNFTIDTLGNIYIANQSNTLNDQLVKLDIADAPSLNFPTATKIGTTDTTDGTLTATVKNIGNQPLTIGGLALSNNNFMIDASATTCSASAPLAAGSACTVGVLFTPNGSGALTGTLTLTDNALNQSGATQQFALSGTGYATPTTTTPAVAVAPTSSSITTAQSDQVTVTVSGTSGSPTPTGTVSLFGGNYTSVTVALSGGQASFTIPAGVLAVGSTTLNAVYTPDAASSTTYGTGAGSTAITVTAVPASTPIVTVTPASIDVSTQQSLTVTIAVSGNPTPTGSVTLAGGNYASLAVTLISGSATITIPAGYLPAGTDTLIAYYTPDPAGKANYNSASGNGQVVAEAGSETMTPTVTVTPASSNISSSQSLQVTMQVSGGSGNATPTGSVILSSGSYASAAAPLYNGSVTLSIPAGTLAVGSNTLVANYAPDTASTLTYTGASGSNTVNAAAAVTAGDFGTIPVGQSGGPILLTFSFTGSGTIGSVTAMMQGAPAMDFAVVSGGSCAAGMSYNSGDICTANVTFSPQFAGLRYGVVIVKDSSGNTVATDFVNGTGSGPQVRLVPKYPRITPPWPTLGGGLSPAGLVADGIGDVFVADANASTGTVVAKEVPAGCMSATCVITLAPTYTLGNKPTKGQSVALDSIGNVFIATSGGGVYEITVASGYQTAITLANGFAFTGPTGLAVDQSGNVFIAAGANGGTENGVYEIPAAGGYATVNQVATGLIDPIGLAVDMNGNLFVSTASNGTANPNGVYEISATSGYTMFQAVGSGFSSPQGLTVDQDGNVFVLDTSYYGIYEILAAGGYTTVDALPLDLYERITVDASGNIYLPSSGGGTIDKVEFADALMIFRTATTVQTADTTDSPLPFTVQNIGNAELNLTAITPPSANFTIDSGTTTCSTSTPLAAGASCIVGVDFAPAAVGALSGTLTLTDNNLNASNATQDVYLSGTGAAAPTVATPVIAPPTGTYYTNQSVTITDSTANAVICYTTDNTAPTASNGTCTHGTAYGGAISVVQTGAVVQAIGTLAGDNNSALATATYTLQAVAPTLLPPGGTYVGAQSVTLSTTTTGSQIYYTTDGTTPTGAAPSILYNSATPIAVIASGTVINAIAVYDGYQNSTVSTGTYILQYPAVTLTSSLTFTAGVGATSAAQSATLQNTGTAPLTGIVISIAGTDLSNFTQTATTCGATLAAGASCTISVTFSPTAVTSYSATISVADNAAGSPQTTVLNGTGIAPTFTVASATPTQTVQPGGAATYTINVNPVNGSYTSAVTLTASGLPSGATASFSPNPVTPGAEGTSSTLTVQTAAPVTTAANLRWPLAAPALALIGILFLPRRRARHWLALGILMLASLGALTLSGCGGGFYSGSASHSYTITVTGTSGTDVQTTTVQLTVE